VLIVGTVAPSIALQPGACASSLLVALRHRLGQHGQAAALARRETAKCFH
jgi:hypothetical protein